MLSRCVRTVTPTLKAAILRGARPAHLEGTSLGPSVALFLSTRTIYHFEIEKKHKNPALVGMACDNEDIYAHIIKHIWRVISYKMSIKSCLKLKRQCATLLHLCYIRISSVFEETHWHSD